MRVDDLHRIAVRQAGVVHRRQLRELGLTHEHVARRIDAGTIIPLHGGVLRLIGTPPSWEQRLWGALLSARRTSVVSHRSAAHLHHIGRFGPHQVDIIEVSDLTHRLATGVDAHRSSAVPDHHRMEISGLPLTTIERTIFDLASLVSVKRYRRGLPSLRHREVERALDDALAKGAAIAGFERLLAEHGGRGRGGTVVLRGLMAMRGEGFVATESELEDVLAAALERYGLPAPVRQRNIGGLEDRIGRVDFLYVDARVVIEADGRKNHTALMDREGDAWRDLELVAAGFAVVRVTWTQLKEHPDRFVRHLRALLALRP